MQLPPNLNKNPQFRNKSIEEIVALKPSPAAHNTINKALTRVAALFKWAVSYGYSTFNPAGSMSIKKIKRASEERKAFSKDDLRLLFCSSDFIESKHKESYQYWTPLIALYTGARLNEIAQLHINDFQEIDSVSVISINDEIGEGKRLKTGAAKRLIPIHYELIRLGLLQYVSFLRTKGVPRLFPELKLLRDGYGQTVSKWFARYRKKCGINESGKVFHSFRHTVVDQLKQAGVATPKIAALVGHEEESITLGRYGKDFKPSVMLETVNSIDARVTEKLAAYVFKL